MSTRKSASPLEIESREATQQDVPSPGASTIGVSGLTGVPASVPNDAPVPLETREEGTEDESMRDDTAQQTTRARFKMPSWFTILWQNKKARVGLIMLACFILVALLAPVLAPYDPHNSSFLPSEQPSADHLLGTTQAGQDVLSQLIYGTRTSLLVGALAGALAGGALRRRWLSTSGVVAWALLTGRFCARRLRGTARTPRHLAEMIATSALIPPLAVYWRLRGALRYRVLFL